MKKMSKDRKAYRGRAAVLAWSLILLLTAGSLTGTWNVEAAGASAADIELSAERTAAAGSTRPDPENGEGSGTESFGAGKTGEDNTGKAGTASDKAGEDTSGKAGTASDKAGEDTSGEAGTGSDKAREDNSGEAGTASDGNGEDNSEKTGTGSDRTGPEGSGTDGTGQEGPGAGHTGSDRAGEGDTGPESARDQTDAEGAGETSAESGEESRTDKAAAEAAEGVSADPADNRETDPGEVNADRTVPGAGGSGADRESAGGEDSAVQKAAAGDTALPAEAVPAAGTGETMKNAEPWMTTTQFRRAFEKVTTGASYAGASTLSKATIISKENEIDYEELGIGKDVSGHPGHTTPVNIRDENGDTYTGVCVVPDDRGWAKWTVLPNVTRVTDAVMIKLYYYTMLDGYGESLAKSKGFGQNAKKVAIAACHEAMAMRYAELAGIRYDRPNVGSNLSSLVSAYRSGAAAKSLPDSDRVFVYISARTQSGGNWMQAYVFGRIREDEPSNVILTKESSDPDMRNAYSIWYCLHETESGGTVNFRMYSDKACTKQVKVYGDPNMTAVIDPIPVGLSGKSGLWNQAVIYCPPGTYYLKELTTPRGYQTHKDPFGPYTLQEGKGKNIKVTNTPRYARVGIIKKDEETGENLADAEFGLYADKEDARNAAEPQAIFRIGTDGRSNTQEVLAGKTYYVRETKAPAGHKLLKTIKALNVAESFTTVAWTEITNEKEYGTVQVKKVPEEGIDVETQGSPYSLAGAVYTLYDKEGKTAGTLTTGEDGTSEVLTVPAGEYTLKETTPSPGFTVDTEVRQVTVREETPALVTSKEPARKGSISVHKTSSMEKEGRADDTLPLAGAVYGLYASEEDARQERAAAGTFVIRGDGSSNEVHVPAGTAWYVKETRAPEGYLPDKTIHEVRVESLTEPVVVESQDRPIAGGVKVCKCDLETGKPLPVGAATLEGTGLKIYNDSEYSVYADGKKILPGREAMTLTTGEDGTAMTGARALSYGTYRIEETGAPEGYTLKGAEPVRFSVTKDGFIVDLSGKTETCIRDRVIRGDFALSKINGYSQKRMAGVTFEVTALDRDGKPAQTCRFTTGEDGSFASTAAWASGAGANAGAGAGPAADAGPSSGSGSGSGTGTGTGSDTGQGAAAGQARIWFGEGTLPDDQLGALPFGAYRIREIEGKNNRGMKMYSGSFSIDEDGQVVDLGTIENTLRPVIETDLVDEDGDHYADRRGMVTLTDTVTWQGMEDYIGKEVTFHGVIYVKETGEPLLIDGKTVECVETRRISAHSGTVKLRFTFDGQKAQGWTLVCFEYASEAKKDQTQTGGGSPGSETSEGGTSGTEADYHDSTNGGKDICAHTDPEDQAQTVHLVSVETDAGDLLTGLHIGEARDGAVTVDHVTCRGLIPGQTYRVTGILVDKADGKPLADADGKEVTAEASFTADSPEETVDLTFTYDASLIAGTTVVAFERLFLDGAGQPAAPGGGTPQTPGGEEPDGPAQPGDPTETPSEEVPIAVHEDPEDEDQSIHYPQIRTHAAGRDGETKTLTAGGTVTVCDRVTWKNLVAGRTYCLRGTLMRKDTGEALAIGGKAVTAQASFTPDTGDGETVLEFTFAAEGLFGQSADRDGDDGDGNPDGEAPESLQIVAFEDLYISVPGPDPGREDAGPDEPGGEDPAGDGPQTGSTGEGPEDAGDGGQTEEVLIASHKDLEDPAQTVLLRGPERPQSPGTPQEPDRPDKPVNPDREEGSSKTDSPKKENKTVRTSAPETIRTTSAPRTGDETRPAALLALVLVSAVITAGILAVRKRSGRKQ